MKPELLLFPALAACLLSSCISHVSTRIADYGREFEGVIVPMDAELPTWRVKDSRYIQGSRTLFERRGVELYDVLFSAPSGQLTARPGAATQVAYVSVIPRGRSGDSLCSAWLEAPWMSGRYECTNDILDELPPGASLEAESLMVCATCRTGTRVNDTPEGIVYLTGESHATSHAWWAYPLAGIAFVGVDLPVTVVSALTLPVVMPCAEIYVSLKNVIYNVMAEED